MLSQTGADHIIVPASLIVDAAFLYYSIATLILMRGNHVLTMVLRLLIEISTNAISLEINLSKYFRLDRREVLELNQSIIRFQ